MRTMMPDIIAKIAAVLLPVLLLLVWQYAVVGGYADPTMLPPPSDIWASFVELARSGKLTIFVLDSCRRVVLGFLICGGLGLILGIIFGLHPRLRTASSVLLGVIQPIPPIALIPVFILWLGIGEASKVAIIVMGSFWSVLLNTEEGVRAADPELVELAYVLEKSRKETLVKIIFPSAIPLIITGIRLGFSRAWSCVVAAEMIAASSGLGYLIEFARNLSQPALMFLGVGLIGLIGLIIDVSMLALQRKLVYWHATH